MNKDNRLYGIRDNGTVEGYYIETYYTPCKGIVTDIDNQLVRVVADNDATDVETRVLFSTLESDGWINPKEASDLRAQLAEARKDSERLDWVVCSCNDYGFDIGANNAVINRLYWIDGIDEIARGKTPREAIDNAIKGGE